jgi:hypothetical protein
MDNDDPIAVGYFKIKDAVYRFKVWDVMVWMERQGRERGSNIPINRNDDPDADLLYNDSTWDLEAMIRLIEHYNSDQLD